MTKASKVTKIILALLLMPLLLNACAQNRSVPMKSAMGEQGYVLGSGDALRIIVYGQDELSGQFTIDPSGTISMPLIKDIKASGLTVRDLEKTITNQLQPTYLTDPKVSVEVIEYRSVYILGEVRTPGKYAYVPNMTVLQAIAVAGGHTYRANESSAEVTRLEKDVLRTFTAPINYMIQPGDTVIIKRRWF